TVRETIRKDLVYAAIRANAWLITSGKNVGVAKEVGEGLKYYRHYIEKHKYNLPCIGGTSWNSIAGYAQRETKTKNLSRSASSSRKHSTYLRDKSSTEHTIQIHDNDHNVEQTDSKCKKTEELNLEPNHTHFLLFDDKVKNDDFVLHLLEHVEWRWSNNSSNNKAEQSPIPIVMVLVESNTQLNTTKVKSVKPGIPVVVLKHRECTNENVGGLHTCYSDCKIDNDVVTSTNSTISQNIISVEGSKEAKINSIYKSSSNESQVKIVKINSVRNDSCEILEKCKHPVTVFKISSNRHHRNFEDAILLSLSNGKQQFYLENQRFFCFVTARRNAEMFNQQHKLANELILAIAWNRFDYAREYLLTDKTRPNYTEGDLNRALRNALYHSHIDFIELLLDFGASFKNLTHEDLKKLYDQPSHNPLPIANKEKPLNKSQYYADYIEWIGTTPLNLLLGVHIYRYATRFKINTNMQEQYHKHANQLEEIAVSIIDMSYEYDKEFTYELLEHSVDTFNDKIFTYELLEHSVDTFNDKIFTYSLLEHSVDTFNDTTLLKFAETVPCKSFLASRCVQRHLQKICPIMLVNYFPLNIYGESRSGYAGLPMPTFEIILHVCIWGLICEEIRQWLGGPYRLDKWNLLDIATIIFYLVGFITRFFRYEETFIASKIFMCLDLILCTDSQVYWYYSSNGSLFNATVPRTGINLWSAHLFRNVTNYGVWKIFGQVETINDIDAYSYVAFALDIIFVAIANVLLLNVLVALFNVTISDVAERSKQIWGYERYLIIIEYEDKPSIPPPLVKDSNSSKNKRKIEDYQCCWYTLKRENMDQIVAALEKIGLKFSNWQERINHK
ncbi:unnamed protein product, partial [Rotaria sordida]